jgi:lipopolysaccharide export LptBFGC system permease protein LptF
VKTIAEHARVPTPGFVEYIWKFALPILLPAFALVSISFFSR